MVAGCSGRVSCCWAWSRGLLDSVGSSSVGCDGVLSASGASTAEDTTSATPASDAAALSVNEASVDLLALAVRDPAVVERAVDVAGASSDDLSSATAALARFEAEGPALVVVVLAFFAFSGSTAFLVARVFVAVDVAVGCGDEVDFFAAGFAAVVALRTVFVDSETVAAGSLTTTTGSSAMTFFGLPGRFLIASAMMLSDRVRWCS